jgi:hypothetical protein
MRVRNSMVGARHGSSGGETARARLRLDGAVGDDGILGITRQTHPTIIGRMTKTLSGLAIGASH